MSVLYDAYKKPVPLPDMTQDSSETEVNPQINAFFCSVDRNDCKFADDWIYDFDTLFVGKKADFASLAESFSFLEEASELIIESKEASVAAGYARMVEHVISHFRKEYLEAVFTPEFVIRLVHRFDRQEENVSLFLIILMSRASIEVPNFASIVYQNVDVEAIISDLRDYHPLVRHQTLIFIKNISFHRMALNTAEGMIKNLIRAFDGCTFEERLQIMASFYYIFYHHPQSVSLIKDSIFQASFDEIVQKCPKEMYPELIGLCEIAQEVLKPDANRILEMIRDGTDADRKNGFSYLHSLLLAHPDSFFNAFKIDDFGNIAKPILMSSKWDTKIEVAHCIARIILVCDDEAVRRLIYFGFPSHLITAAQASPDTAAITIWRAIIKILTFDYDPQTSYLLWTLLDAPEILASIEESVDDPRQDVSTLASLALLAYNEHFEEESDE